MMRSLITDQALINQSKPGSGQEPTKIERRTLIGGALVALLASPGLVMAKEKEKAPKDPFVLLLNGPYHHVDPGTGPDLHLSKAGVNLNDDSYSTTKIYPVHVEGIPCDADEQTAIGNFYVQSTGPLAAYQLPGGAIAMRFDCGGFPASASDGLGGFYMTGTWELTILEATGIYRSFEGGHNHMVDRLHFLGDENGSGGLDEYCFCFITRR